MHRWESTPPRQTSAPIATRSATARFALHDPEAAAIPIAVSTDIATARQAGRECAIELGFSPTDVTMISTAISEVARNITSYAGHGEIRLRVSDVQGRDALVVQARDEGPGIPDTVAALGEGITSGRRLGLGLPGARRLMDGLSIESAPGQGTLVEMWKWIPVSAYRGPRGH